MWAVENINGDDSLVRKEFEAYSDAKAYSELTLGYVFYACENRNLDEDKSGGYYNKGNDCDNCKNQYIWNGDAEGCKCVDAGKECDFSEVKND